MNKIILFLNKRNGKKFFTMIEKGVDPKEKVSKDAKNEKNIHLNHPFYIDFRNYPSEFDISTIKEGNDVTRNDLRDILKNQENLYYNYFNMNEGKFNEIKSSGLTSNKEIEICSIFWGYGNYVRQTTQKIAKLFSMTEGQVLRIVDKVINVKTKGKGEEVFWDKAPNRKFKNFYDLSEFVFKSKKYAFDIEKVAYGLDNQFKGEKFYFTDFSVKENFHLKAQEIIREIGTPIFVLSEKYNMKRELVKEILRRGGKIKEKRRNIPIVLERKNGQEEKYTSMVEVARELFLDEKKAPKIKKIIEDEGGKTKHGTLKYSEEALLKTNKYLLDVYNEALKILNKYKYKKTETVNRTKENDFYKKIIFHGNRKFMTVVMFESKIVISFSSSKQIVLRHNTIEKDFLKEFEVELNKFEKEKRIEIKK